MQPRLTEIANHCGTDKGSIVKAGSGYTLVYEMLFEPLRDRPINLLEIGLAIGGPEVGVAAERAVTDAPSIRMWHEYFKKAHIYGLDISDFSALQTEWFTFFHVDCGKADQLSKVAMAGVEFDIIIDDGSHASYHQQLTMKYLFPLLKPGGLYIIEDLGWQPSAYESSLPASEKTANLLGRVLDSGKEIPDHAGMGSILLFDEDQLVTLRRLYNRKTGHTPEMRYYIETPSARGYARRLLENAEALWAAVLAKPRPRHRVKLAVIQKTCDVSR